VGTTIYQLPLAAVIVSAWLGGRGPGIFAFLICATGILYWLIPPASTFHLPPDYLLGFCLFALLCLLLIEFSAARWRVQRALEESDRRFRLMAEAVPEMLWFESIDPRGMLYASPRFNEIWGRPHHELERRADLWLEAIHPEDRPNVSSAYERFLNGEGSGRFDATFRILRPDGETRLIHSRATLIRDQDGTPYRACGIAADVTEEQRAAEALAKAKTDLAHVARVTTVGQLAASIAHEVNQPLGAMVANAAACDHWLAAKPPETTKAQTALKTIVADGQRASAVIGRIRALMQRQPPRIEPVDVNQVIRDVMALAQEQIRRHGIVLETLLADGLPMVQGDRVQLQQVLLNLVVNAVEAMSGAAERPRELMIVSKKHASNGVLVTVRDNGVGLNAAITDRLFEPFYTTKAEGLGMGLAISRSIMESHGGRIWASPNTPRGAVFQLELPGSARS
jgi:PAS domain S-box-containing protein